MQCNARNDVSEKIIVCTQRLLSLEARFQSLKLQIWAKF